MKKFVIRAKKPQDVVEFHLEQDGDVIKLMARAAGCEWHVAEITPDQGIGLNRAIPEAVGLAVDERGYVKTFPAD